MKKYTLLFVVYIAATILIVACKKEEIVSKRLTKGWQINKVIHFDGTDITQNYPGDVIEFQEGGVFIVWTIWNNSRSGTWVLTDNATNIVVTNGILYPDFNGTLGIITLNKDEFVCNASGNGNKLYMTRH